MNPTEKYVSQYYTCEEIDQRLLQGYYDDFILKNPWYDQDKETFLRNLGLIFRSNTGVKFDELYGLTLNLPDHDSDLLIDENGKVRLNKTIDTNLIEVKYEDLVKLRDEHKLIPGTQYRIVDYECTTAQEGTRSAFFRFDIVVTADDDNTLNENARAMYHEAMSEASLDDYYLIGKQTITNELGESKEAYVWENRWYSGNGDAITLRIATDSADKSTFTKETTTHYFDKDNQVWYFNDDTLGGWALFDENDTLWKSHFEESKLEAWDLKYCLDNDTERFLWAVNHPAAIKVHEEDDPETIYIHVRYPEGDSDGKYAWAYVECEDGSNVSFETILWNNIDPGDLGYTDTEDIIPGVTIFTYGDYSSPVIDYHDNNWGKGVIYYMKDEFNNECPYDFKNIQFKRYKADSSNEDLDGLYIAVVGDMQRDVSIQDEDDFIWCYTFTKSKEEIVDSSVSQNNLGKYYDGYSGVIGNTVDTCIGELYMDDEDHITLYILNNNIFYTYHQNYLDNSCMYNTFSGITHDNTLLSGSYNSFSNECRYNVLGNGCISNTFKEECVGNTLNDCKKNSFGIHCIHTELFSSNDGNTFGNGCDHNTLSKFCSHNSFGNDCNSNSLSESCYSNSFGNSCYANIIGSNSNFNSFGNECQNNQLGDLCESNSLGNSNKINSLADECSYNHFDNNCNNNRLAGTNVSNFLGTGCHHNIIGSECSDNHLDSGCYYNTFSQECSYNRLNQGCYENEFLYTSSDNHLNKGCNNNTFNEGCKCNTLGMNCIENEFKNGCTNNTLGNLCSQNILHQNCSQNTFGDTNENNTLGKNCLNNRFGNDCYVNILGHSCRSNNFGNDCSYISIGSKTIQDPDEVLGGIKFCEFGDNCCYLYTDSSEITSGYMINYVVLPGTSGEDELDTLEIFDKTQFDHNYSTICGLNSEGELKRWVPADLLS